MRPLAALCAACIWFACSHAAVAQPDTSKWVGAVPKSEVAGLGSSPAVTTIATSGTAKTLVFPTTGSVAYDVTLTANCTFTIDASAATAGQRQTIYLLVRNPSGSFTTTLPGSVKWSNAAAPTIATTAGTVIEIALTTMDGGTTVVAR